MSLLLDTHTLAWFAAGDGRFSSVARAAIEAPDAALYVSAITAYEYSDLLARDRLPTAVGLNILERALGFILLDYPADLWVLAASLPNLHRDPVDRMLIAQAIAADLTLVTADETMRRYPVKSLW